jgi:hypothetical protein
VIDLIVCPPWEKRPIVLGTYDTLEEAQEAQKYHANSRPHPHREYDDFMSPKERNKWETRRRSRLVLRPFQPNNG